LSFEGLTKKKIEVMGPKAVVTTGSVFQILAKPHKSLI